MRIQLSTIKSELVEAHKQQKILQDKYDKLVKQQQTNETKFK